MSGVTCQFCGKPLWRIRRGSDGDFCSREHRNQYKLRMGLSHLAEAEKVSTVRRRCENPNVLALSRPAGSPELQKRRSSACLPSSTSSALGRLARPREIGKVGIGAQPAPLQIEAARRPSIPRKGEAARDFASRPRLSRLGVPRPAGTNAAVSGAPALSLRVPLADGALRHPVFLIARFPQHRPTPPRPPAPRRTAASAEPAARTLECRPRTVGCQAKTAASPFAPAPWLGHTSKADDLADLVFAPYPITSYRPCNMTAERRRFDQEHMAWPPPPLAVTLESQPLRATVIARAVVRPMIEQLQPWTLDSSRERKSSGPAPPAPSTPVLRAAPAGSRHRDVESLPRSLDVASLSGEPAQPRTAALSRRQRAIGRGRRAAWSGRARLPGFQPDAELGRAAAGSAATRLVRVAYAAHTVRAIAPAFRVAVGAFPEEQERTVSRPAQGPVKRRTLELPPPPKDLVVAPRRPALQGTLAERMQETSVQVLEENFGAGLGQWDGDTSAWKIDIAGVRPAGAALFRPSLGLTDYRLEFLARVERGSLTCLFRAQSPDTGQVLRIVSGGGAMDRYVLTEGSVDSRASAALTGIPSGKALNVRLEARGRDFSIAVNGRLIDRWNDSRTPSGGVGFSSNPEDRVRLYWVKLSYGMPVNHPAGTRQL